MTTIKSVNDDRAVSLAYHDEIVKEAQRQIHALEAERDKLAATIGRVREWAHEEFGTTPKGLRAAPALAPAPALDPEPAFVLPTEVPARIIAEPKDDSSIEYVFVLWSDGNGGQSWWLDFDDDSSELYGPERLMREFRNHRAE